MDFPGHFQRIFQQLNQQRLHRQLCDCVVLVGGQSFPAHRSILAACSSHFRALLSSAEGDESQGGGAGVGCGGGPGVMALDQGVVTPEAFSTLLNMIYTSTLTLGSSNVMDVLLAASHLHLNTVVKACKLHLSKCNFPTSPPKGWRSVQQQQNEASMSSQAVATAEAGCKQLMSVSPYHLELRLDIPFTAEELCGDETGAEVSQSGGVGEDGAETDGVSREQNTTLPAGKRRRSTFHEERLSGTKRSYYRERSPTVTRSTANGEERAEELSSSDSPEAPEGSLIQMVGSEEVEEKYEATKRESEEIELPSQSDGNPGGVGEGGREAHSESVVKVKVGEEKEEESEEEKMVFVEVKKENLSSSSWSTELDGVPDISPTPARDSSDRLGETADEEKLATAGPAESICGALGPQLCADPDTESGDVGEDPMGSGGLESLSELAFSCFLNPSSESVLGALEVEDSLASLAAAATTAAATTTMEALATTGDAGEQCQDVNASSTTSSDCSSSIVFPVSAVPFQQLLSTTQSQSFSDTLILRPAQSALGLLSGIKPGVSLQAALLSASSTGRNRGCATLGSSAFRRIAPKTAPGSEAGTDSDPSSSSGSSGEAAQRPALTRASEEVLSKCKKAAAEDHVLLVEGEKKYACRICCKTFMNLTDCKKHIRVHTGEKPYPCPKCGKRFSQSSHLYKHSKNTCLHWKGDQQPFLDSLL